MRLNGDFYRIESRLEDRTLGQSGFKVILNPDHLIYKAHFPGQPVTPGVCILQIIQELNFCIEALLINRDFRDLFICTCINH